MHHFHYQNRELSAESVPLSRLTQKYGSPLYVYSESTLREHYQRLSEAMSGVDHHIQYAVKANSNLEVLRVLARMGSQFDIVSVGELFRVMEAGGRADRCTFAGVGKTDDEIRTALEKGIYSFIAESESELKRIDRLAGEAGVTAPVALRVNPNVDAATHAKITTGTYENKFGVDFESAAGVYERASRLPHLRLRGVHIHIGSQITKVTPFARAVKKMLKLVRELKKEYGIEFFDIGGGIGVVYDPALESGQAAWWRKMTKSGKAPLTPSEYADRLLPLLEPLELTILMEPGRYMTANAGVLVTRVIDVKETARKRFVIVDAAMNDLARPSMYDAYHEIVPLVQSRRERVSTDVVGPVCESGDTFCKNRMLPKLKAGEEVALMTAGAYGFTMAGNYNSRPLPAEVMVKGKNARLIRGRQTLDDLIALERL